MRRRVVVGEVQAVVSVALAEKVAAGVVAEGSGSGKLLAVTAESKRCVDGAPVQRRGVAAAAQRSALLGGAARRGGARVAAAEGWIGFPGGAAWAFKGAGRRLRRGAAG